MRLDCGLRFGRPKAGVHRRSAEVTGCGLDGRDEMELRKEVDMKKVKCWKCNGLGKVPLELPRICSGAPGCPTHKKCDVCEGKGWNWE